MAPKPSLIIIFFVIALKGNLQTRNLFFNKIDMNNPLVWRRYTANH
jgi:hypothetical protein